MASAAFHLDRSDVPAGYVAGVDSFRYITVNITDGVTLFFPAKESHLARTLAAELIRVADEFDATVTAAPVESVEAAAAAAKEVR